MERGWLWRLVISMLVVGLWLGWLLMPQGRFPPIELRPVPGNDLLSVAESSIEQAGLSGVKAGDILDFSATPLATRLAFYGAGQPVGQAITVVVIRDGKPVATQVAFVEREAADFHFMLIQTVPHLLLGLLLLWRGRTPLSGWLCVFFLASTTVYSLHNIGLPLPWNTVSAALARLVVAQIRNAAIIAAAYVICRDYLSRTWNRTWIIVALSILVVRGIAATVDFIFVWLNVNTDAIYVLINPLGNACFFVAVGIYLTAYARAPGAVRLRIRWLMLATLFLALDFVPLSLQIDRTLAVHFFSALMQFLQVVCFAYAVLSNRLVEISFVVSRGFVYAIVAALMVGVFATLEHAIASKVIGHNAGIALHIAVPLLLGIALHRVRERIEHWVERLFFRRQYLVERELKRITRESEHFDKPEVLLTRTLSILKAQIGAQRVGVYLLDGESYRLAGQEGEAKWPTLIDGDDPALVTLRSTPQALGLYKTESSLKGVGTAFPMFVAGQLQGVLLCGERAAAYSPAELELVAALASSVASALYGLEARHNAQVLRDLSAGTISVEELGQKNRSWRRRIYGSIEPDSHDFPHESGPQAIIV